MELTGERMIPEYSKGDEIYLEHMARYMFASQFVKDKEVVDIACGSGYGTKLLSGCGVKKITGFDIDPEAVAYCQKKYTDNVTSFEVGSVEKIPAGDKSADVLVSFETIEHVEGQEQLNFLSEVVRILKSNGVFIVSTPNVDVFPKGNTFHKKELTKKEFSDILNKHFKNVEILVQDDLEVSCITVEDFDFKNKSKILIDGSEKIDLGNPMYYVAICSNDELDLGAASKNFMAVSAIRTWVNLFENYKLKGDVENLKNEISIKETEISQMKESKFWKLRELYIKNKNILKSK